MSAYVVDPSHIDALISVAANGPRDRQPQYPGDGWYGPWSGDLAEGTSRVNEQPSECGAALLAECIASVSYRYPDDSLATLPGPVPIPDPKQYEWTDLGRAFTTLEALNMIAGYEYQSCEHPDWPASGAYHFCNRLRAALVGSLPGYRDADGWHVTAERAIEAAGLRV